MGPDIGTIERDEVHGIFLVDRSIGGSGLDDSRNRGLKIAIGFEIEPRWLVDAASRRQKWIDQAQSLNIYMAGVSGKKLDDIYKLAWQRGLKTTYYLRTMGATSAEKSTVAAGQLNAVSSNIEAVEPKFCAIDDPECEACQ